MDYPLHRFTDMAALTADEMQRLRSLGDPPVHYGRKATVRSEGEPADCIYLLLDGWVAASMMLPSGSRQIMKVHLPGDVLGSPSMALDAAAETLTVLTPCALARVPLRRLRDLFASHPRLAGLFLMAAQFERVALMDTIASIGRTDAREQIIAFLLDLHDRLARIGAVEDGSFEVPMTQAQISDKLGMTPIHLNRTLRVLEAEGLISCSGRTFELHDMVTLRRQSQLPRRRLRPDPEWLPAATGE